jgi:hypothetical protein
MLEGVIDHVPRDLYEQTYREQSIGGRRVVKTILETFENRKIELEEKIKNAKRESNRPDDDEQSSV